MKQTADFIGGWWNCMYSTIEEFWSDVKYMDYRIISILRGAGVSKPELFDQMVKLENDKGLTKVYEVIRRIYNIY